MPNLQKRLDLQERDLDILDAIADMNYATIQHVATLFPSTQDSLVIQGQFKAGYEAIAKRLRKLEQHDYLELPNIRYSQRLYMLGKAGAEALAKEERSLSLEELTRQIRRQRERKDAHIEHTLGINTFRIGLVAALREQTKADWLRTDDGRPYWTQPTIEDKPLYEVTIKKSQIPAITKLQSNRDATMASLPDGTFILKPDKKQDHTVAYIYEKDRGTERGVRLPRKLLAYLHWHKDKQRRYNLFATKHLRILIETETEQRAKNLIEKVALQLTPHGSALFWFTTKDQISLDNPAWILEPIWILGHANHYDPDKSFSEQEKHSLLEFTP